MHLQGPSCSKSHSFHSTAMFGNALTVNFRVYAHFFKIMRLKNIQAFLQYLLAWLVTFTGGTKVDFVVFFKELNSEYISN